MYLMIWRQLFFFDFYFAERGTEQQNELIKRRFTQLRFTDLSNYKFKIADHRGSHETQSFLYKSHISPRPGIII